MDDNYVYEFDQQSSLITCAWGYNYIILAKS